MWIKGHKGGLVNLNMCAGITIFKMEVLAFYGNGTDEQCLLLFIGTAEECRAYVDDLFARLGGK